jgi:hypothetical protein
VNQHVREVVLKFQALLLLQFLHLLDLLLLIHCHVGHLVVHGRGLLLLTRMLLLRVRVHGEGGLLDDLLDHAFFNILVQVVLLIFLADIFIQIIIIEVVLFIFICGWGLRLLMRPVFDPERRLNAHYLRVLLIYLLNLILFTLLGVGLLDLLLVAYHV